MTHAGKFLELWREAVLGLSRPAFVKRLGLRAQLDLNRVTNIESGKILLLPEYLDDLKVFPQFDAFTRRWFEAYIREDSLDKVRWKLPPDFPRLDNSIDVVDVIHTIVSRSYWELGYELQENKARPLKNEDGHPLGTVEPDNRPLNSAELAKCEREIELRLGKIESIDPLGGTKAELATKIREEVLETMTKVLRPPRVALDGIRVVAGWICIGDEIIEDADLGPQDALLDEDMVDTYWKHYLTGDEEAR